MTTIEHAMLGINGLLATGLHRRYGWQLAAIAGVVAVAPDWDGLTMLGGMELMDRAHRVWGHGLITAIGLAVALGLLDYRFDLVTRFARMFTKVTGIAIPDEELRLRDSFSAREAGIWCAVATGAVMLHLLGDMIVSGGKQLTDWGLQLFWPLSDREFIYPLVPWGDIGITLIFVVGMFGMLRWKNRTQLIAIISLASAAIYAVMRSVIIG